MMVFAMMMPAFAAGHGTITINNAVTGHTYTAYQIFKGTINETGDKLGDIEWGTGITDAGKTALYTKYNLSGDDQTAAKVAEAIVASSTTGAATADDSKAIELANTVGTNVQSGTAGTLSGTTCTFSNLDDGYYMIVDTWNGTGTEGIDYTLARYMVQLVGTATLNNKADKPKLEKKIVEGSALVDGSTENIGDTVNYKVTSKVPEYDGYKEYYMDFTDVLSKGLDFVTTGGTVTGISVKIGNYDLTADDFTVTVNSTKVR